MYKHFTFEIETKTDDRKNDILDYLQRHLYEKAMEVKDEDLDIISDIFWGMGKEFSIQFDGEDYSVYGYYIADCEYRSYSDIKTYFCKMEGLKEEETVLEVVSGCHTVTHYDYETI